MSTDSDATDDREENGENGEHKEQVRAHFEALAETDLPYAEYAERVLRALGSEDGSDER